MLSQYKYAGGKMKAAAVTWLMLKINNAIDFG
jgi:hypothetical protein